MVEKQFTILGQPYVKKNNQKVRFDRRRGYPIKYNTAGYKRWHDNAVRYFVSLGYNPNFTKLNKQYKKMGMKVMEAEISCGVNLQCRFFMPTDGRVDLSALYEGIQDVLVEVGVLSDDNCHIVKSHDGSGVSKDPTNPRMEIIITEKEAKK